MSGLNDEMFDDPEYIPLSNEDMPPVEHTKKKKKKKKKKRHPMDDVPLDSTNEITIDEPFFQVSEETPLTNSSLNPISCNGKNDTTSSGSCGDIPPFITPIMDGTKNEKKIKSNNHPNSVDTPTEMSIMPEGNCTSSIPQPNLTVNDITMEPTSNVESHLTEPSTFPRRVSINLSPTVIDPIEDHVYDSITGSPDKTDANVDFEKSDSDINSSIQYPFATTEFSCTYTKSVRSDSDDTRSDSSVQSSVDQPKNSNSIFYNQTSAANAVDVGDLGSEIDNPFFLDDDDDEEEEMEKHRVYELLEGRNLTWRRRLRDIFEGNPHIMDRRKAVIMNVITLLTIVVSCLVFVISSMPQYVNEGILYSPLFWIETICIVIFIIEVILRVAVTRMKRLVNLFFVIDILAILGYFLDLLINLFAEGFIMGFAILRIVRLIRVFRVFKLSRHSKSLQLTYVVLKNSASDLTVLLVPVVLIVTLFGCAIYLFELLPMTWSRSRRRWEDKFGFPAHIQSIPDAMWLCMETITTVGYGDIVPHTIGGKLCSIFVQFTGVLLLSFPNIVLGGNLQFAFKSHSRHSAIKYLGKKFRKVFMALLFIKIVRQKAEEKKMKGGDQHTPNVYDDDDDCENLRDNSNNETNMIGMDSRKAVKEFKQKKIPTNYLLQKPEFEIYRKEEPSIKMETLRTWQYKNISAVSVLKRLLQVCSGVGTTDEIHHSFIVEGSEILLRDLDIVVLYLFEADLLQVFVFKKFGLTMLCALTPSSVVELQVHPEENDIECIRSAEVARVMWRRTVGTTVSFCLSHLMVTYPNWASNEKLAENESYSRMTDLKQFFDSKNECNSLSNKRCGSKSLMVNPLHKQAQAVTLSEAKEHMRKVLANRNEQIEILRKRVREAEQNVTNMYGF